MVETLLGGLLSGLSSATVGVVTGLFIVLFLLTNNTLQNLLEPMAFGKAVGLRTVDLLRETGIFAQRATASGRSKASA
jgi:hypothetical protein